MNFSVPTISTIVYNNYEIGILRLDELHSEISGNKWYKLKYNLQQAKAEGKKIIVTFGGAFSNHIAATALACKQLGFKSVGIIRGEEGRSINNTTLQIAQLHGMQLQFVNRDVYKQKNEAEFLKILLQQFPNAYIIPEGGDNELGQLGCQEILTDKTINYNTICCAYGTGTTFKGIAKSLLQSQYLLGINVLNYNALTSIAKTSINNDFHFGGYAKHTEQLLEFKNWFEIKYLITLDYVYTAKLFFAIFELINQQKINATQSLLIIHSGGLQGNIGYEKRYKLLEI